jgi:hypothetical protein
MGNNCCREKAVRIKCERVSVFMLVFCAVLYCHLWPVWPYHILPHYLKRNDFRGKKVIDNKICVFIFSTNLSETFFILGRIKRGTIRNLHKSFRKVRVIRVRF